MSTTTTVATTNVVGYFNGNRWPIHLVISSLNITLKIEPGAFIKDRQGRKINDPFFDAYKQLSKETSAALVPLISVPVVQAVIPRTVDTHSVHEVTEFTLNEHGFRVPVMPKPLPASVVAINAPSVQQMSVEEARRRGLIGKTRAVPEDYGATDRDGPPVPVAEVPPIKYAMEAAPRVATNAPLPQGAAVLSDDSRTQRTARARTQLQQALVEGEHTANELESETGFLNTVVANPAPVPAMPQLPEPALPEPALDEALDQTAEAPPAPRPAPQPLPPKKKFVCAADGKVFEYRSQLVEHVKRKFPHMFASLLAAYPPDLAEVR